MRMRGHIMHSRADKRVTLTVLCATHALIDACCAALVFSLIHIYPLDGGTYLQLVIGYNALAFAFQPLCGIFTDRLRSAKPSAMLGLVFTGAAVVSLLHGPWLTVVFAGLGNAFYHVGGGAASLTMGKGRASFPGMFVAPGALGLAIGAFIGARGMPVLWPFGALLFGAVCLVALIEFPAIVTVRSAEHRPLMNNGPVVALLLLLSVALRSLIGFSAGSLWQGNRPVLLSFAIAAACGKAMGGVAADRFGWIKTCMASLLLCAGCFSGGAHACAAWLSVSGMLLLQMTMPVTLAALYRVLPGRPGLTFGLSCLALVIGAAPAFSPEASLLHGTTVIVPGILLSAAALFAGLRMLPVRMMECPSLQEGAPVAKTVA